MTTIRKVIVTSLSKSKTLNQTDLLTYSKTIAIEIEMNDYLMIIFI